MSDSPALVSWLDRISFLLGSESFDTFTLSIIGYLAILWLAIIIWVTRDAIHRSSHILFQILAVLLNIFLPILGLILYLILRPEKTLLEKYHEDLEYRLLEGGEDFCQGCGTGTREGFSFCPNCGEKLQHSCENCKKEFSRRWKICPYCGENKTVAAEPKKKGLKKK